MVSIYCRGGKPSQINTVQPLPIGGLREGGPRGTPEIAYSNSALTKSCWAHSVGGTWWPPSAPPLPQPCQGPSDHESFGSNKSGENRQQTSVRRQAGDDHPEWVHCAPALGWRGEPKGGAGPQCGKGPGLAPTAAAPPPADLAEGRGQNRSWGLCPRDPPCGGSALGSHPPRHGVPDRETSYRMRGDEGSS